MTVLRECPEPKLTTRRAATRLWILERLLEQGGPSHDVRFHNQWIRYRGAGGRRCSIGWLIPNSEYDERMEGRGFRTRDVMGRSPTLTRLVGGLGPDFVEELRLLHDRGDWEYFGGIMLPVWKYWTEDGPATGHDIMRQKREEERGAL